MRNDTFEFIAEEFYRDTHFMAPGKSEPIVFCTDQDARLDAWGKWMHTRERFIDEIDLLFWSREMLRHIYSDVDANPLKELPDDDEYKERRLARCRPEVG